MTTTKRKKHIMHAWILTRFQVEPQYAARRNGREKKHFLSMQFVENNSYTEAGCYTAD